MLFPRASFRSLWLVIGALPLALSHSLSLTLSHALHFCLKITRAWVDIGTRLRIKGGGGKTLSPVYLDVIYPLTLVSHLERTHTECKTAAWYANEWEFKPSFRFHSSVSVGLRARHGGRQTKVNVLWYEELSGVDSSLVDSSFPSENWRLDQSWIVWRTDFFATVVLLRPLL